ncbi:Pentatricopeptide repeat-containing protein At2g31400, partial [Durusdinium trenchii]
MPDLRGQRQMKNITVEADLISYNSAISACREDAWPYALHLMAVAETDSQQLDVISYSSAVCACETACEWQSAWLLLQTVRQKRLINVIALNSFLSTLARAGQWELALWLIYRERPVKLDVISYSSGINACQKSSSWQHGLFLLQDANGRQLHLNVVSYSAALSTSGPSAWHMVLGLLRRSGNFRLQLNEVSYNGAAGSLSNSSKWLYAFRLLSRAAHVALREPRDGRAAAIHGAAGHRAWRTGLQAAYAGEALNVVSFNELVSVCEMT